MTSWYELEKRLGQDDLTRFIETDVKPIIEELDFERDAEAHKKAMKALERAMTFGFFGGGVLFFFLAVSLPDSWWSIPLKFICFPVFIFGGVALTAWLNRDALMAILLKAKAHFLMRSAALAKLAEKLDLTYVATPGGAPEALKVLAKFKFMPKRFNELIELMDSHGGQDDVVAQAVASGLMTHNVYVIGNDEAKAKFNESAGYGQTFEDGFSGVRNGVSFSALEWVEKVDEAPDKYHLLVFLKPPHRLHGSTHFRSRKTPWPKPVSPKTYSDVDIVPDTFNDHFRLRTTDQVEARTIFNPAVVERVLALAHGQPFRAVAEDVGLVFDFVGDNRFAMVDLASGDWNDDSIKQSVTDIAELLELVDVLAHAFMVRD